MGLRMKLMAKKELIFLFQMAPSRILCDQQFRSYDVFILFLFLTSFSSFPIINIFHWCQFWALCHGWVLHIAKVSSIPSPYLSNMEEQKSWRWLFFLFFNSFDFYFCFSLKVLTKFPEISRILCFVTKRKIICLIKIMIFIRIN